MRRRSTLPLRAWVFQLHFCITTPPSCGCTKVLPGQQGCGRQIQAEHIPTAGHYVKNGLTLGKGRETLNVLGVVSSGSPDPTGQAERFVPFYISASPRALFTLLFPTQSSVAVGSGPPGWRPDPLTVDSQAATSTVSANFPRRPGTSKTGTLRVFSRMARWNVVAVRKPNAMRRSTPPIKGPYCCSIASFNWCGRDVIIANTRELPVVTVLVLVPERKRSKK